MGWNDFLVGMVGLYRGRKSSVEVFGGVHLG